MDTRDLVIYIQFQVLLTDLSVSVIVILNLGRADLSDPLKVWPSVKLTYRELLFLFCTFRMAFIKDIKP